MSEQFFEKKITTRKKDTITGIFEFDIPFQ